ncbi:MAG: hypothetical protein ACFB9M_20580 [Myxococcota bacterium]
MLAYTTLVGPFLVARVAEWFALSALAGSGMPPNAVSEDGLDTPPPVAVEVIRGASGRVRGFRLNAASLDEAPSPPRLYP